LRRRQRAT